MNKTQMTDALEFFVDLAKEWSEGEEPCQLSLLVNIDGSGVLYSRKMSSRYPITQLIFYTIEELANYLANSFDWPD
jgi:hypothetical protein